MRRSTLVGLNKESDKHVIPKSFIEHEQGIIERELKSIYTDIAYGEYYLKGLADKSFELKNKIKELDQAILADKQQQVIDSGLNVLKDIKTVSGTLSDLVKQKKLVIDAYKSNIMLVRYHGHLLHQNPIIPTDIETVLDGKVIDLLIYKGKLTAEARNRIGLESRSIIEKHIRSASSRATTRILSARVHQEVFEAFTSVGKETGANVECLMHEAIGLLLLKHGATVPKILEMKIAGQLPKRRPGPQPGTGGRPKKISLGS